MKKLLISSILLIISIISFGQQNVLVIDYNNSFSSDQQNNGSQIYNRLVATQTSVTRVAAIPATINPATYQQVWIFGNTGLPVPATLNPIVNYMNAGGAVYFQSEVSCCNNQAAFLDALINATVTAGGLITHNITQGPRYQTISNTPCSPLTTFGAAERPFVGTPAANILFQLNNFCGAANVGDVVGVQFRNCDMISGQGALIGIGDFNVFPQSGACGTVGILGSPNRLPLIDMIANLLPNLLNCNTSSQPTFDIRDTIVCGNPIVFTSPLISPGYNYLWSNGATTSSTTINTSGIHWLRIELAPGCFVTDSFTITYNSSTTVSVNDPSICAGQTAIISANPNPTGGSYSWSPTGDTTATISVNPAVTTNYIVTYSLNGCIVRDTATVNVNPLPNTDFNFTNMCHGFAIPLNDISNISSGTIVGWNWSFGDGSPNENSQNPNHLYNGCGTYNVTLTTTSDSVCVSAITKPVEVYPLPQANFSVTEACHGTATQFTDLSTVSCGSTNGTITNWDWDFGDINTSSTQNPSHNYTTFGNYNSTLVITSNYGCKDSITLQVDVYENPPADFVSDTNGGCAPICVTLTANGGGSPVPGMSYLWSYGDDSNGSGINSTHCFQNTGLITKYFNVTLTTIMNYGTKQCTTVTTKNNFISAYPQPVAEFEWNPTLLNILFSPEASFTDNSLGGASQWHWDFGDGGSSTNQNPSHLYLDSGNYTVWLYIETQFGCRDSIWKTLRVEPEYAIYIPNTFTPDKDGINDFFTFKGFGLEEATMMIFDRWGELVYEADGLDVKWDGRIKGQEVGKTDIYIYRIEFKNAKGEYQTYIGKVTLLR
jgi:gliding motility-associated-like protein